MQRARGPLDQIVVLVDSPDADVIQDIVSNVYGILPTLLFVCLFGLCICFFVFFYSFFEFLKCTHANKTEGYQERKQQKKTRY